MEGKYKNGVIVLLLLNTTENVCVFECVFNVSNLLWRCKMICISELEYIYVDFTSKAS